MSVSDAGRVASAPPSLETVVVVVVASVVVVAATVVVVAAVDDVVSPGAVEVVVDSPTDVVVLATPMASTGRS